jgi:phage terminase Nu1 subunit (DNA packaging protein)
MTTVTKGELASRLGVHPSRVSALIKRGLPVRPDRKIDLEAAVTWMKANVGAQAGFQDRGIHLVLSNNVIPLKSGKQASNAPKAPAAIPVPPRPSAPVQAAIPAPHGGLDEDDAGAMAYADAKALRESYLARRAKLDFQKEQGKLLSADAVLREWQATLGAVKSRMMAVSSRCATRLPHLSIHDVAEIDLEVRAGLEELGAC